MKNNENEQGHSSSTNSDGKSLERRTEVS